MRLKSLTGHIFCLLLILSCSAPTLAAEDKKDAKPQGPPPMLVSVSAVENGSAQPTVELVGTVRYVRTSRVSGEISGIVERVHFAEGERVKAGAPLLQLNSDLLQTTISGTRASHEQILIELERARKDLRRIEALFHEESIAEVVYDENHYRVLSLEKQAAALKATLDRQLQQQQKTTIRAPFAGLVLEKDTERGEWVSAGGQVAIIADDREIEIVADVPQNLLGYLKEGQLIDIRSGNQQFQGRFFHFIPQGDVATRTFSVILRLKNNFKLIEGMEAHVMLPSGKKVEGLLVPRDAVIKQRGKDVLFLAVEGKAKMVPVQIRGYQGMQVAVAGEGLEAGQQVVVKGNERIRDGQAIRFQ